MANIDAILQPYQHFGVHLGLDRSDRLLARLGNPHQKMPIIHVGGTNGKGSVCAYLSSVLTAAGYRVGRYTSPHLIDWTERICLNDRPIAEAELISILEQVQQAIDPLAESPTQFEVITAAAWLYFDQQRVDIAIIEVGLGGRLDATNVCDRVLVSVITSISREHWQILGETLGEIAGEKAGILKTGCDAIIAPLPTEAAQVFAERTEQLHCPTVWIEPSLPLDHHRAQFIPPSSDFQVIDYPLFLLGEMQLTNSAIAIATIQLLQQKGWQISPDAIEIGMKTTQWSGRLQWLAINGRKILIDGAHNPAAAIELRRYVDSLQQPVSWLIGMLSTKDHREIFEALLQAGDRLYLVPVPDSLTAHPQFLADLAQSVCPGLQSVTIKDAVEDGLSQAIADDPTSKQAIILCGSLYLVGYFLQWTKSQAGG